jgi:predicted metal-dependent hydrolase
LIRVARNIPYSLQSIQLHVDGIGPVQLERSQKAKRISIRLQPLKGVRVVIPYRSSFEDGQRFLYSKIDWIRYHLPRIENQENKRTLYDETTEFHTFSHQLKLVPHDSATLKGRISKGQLQIFYPAYRHVTDTDIQDYIRRAIEETYRLEAKQYLPQRVAHFARQFGFSYNKVVVKKAGTRWGSCSYRNNINLNLHLMRLPGHLRDYVILHELAHTVEKNHGPNFWALLDQISGDAYGLDKEMKNYRIDIF